MAEIICCRYVHGILQQRGPGHTVADGKIYWKGYGDFLRDIQERLASLDFNNDMDALENGTNGKAWPGSAGA